MQVCLTCGHVFFSATDAALYRRAMQWYPLEALPTCCTDCRDFLAGKPASVGWRRRRRRWLLTATAVPEMDLTDKEVQRKLRKGRSQAKAYKKLIEKQKRRMQKLRWKREWKKHSRELKRRRREMREVLERAAED